MQDPWIVTDRPLRSDPRLRLFLFPYAGGGPSVFRGWSKSLPDWIDVCAVQLPGRGARSGELPFSRMQSLAAVTGKALRPYLDRPFALFGHSMGAILAFELARRWRRLGLGDPKRLFVAGRGAPDIRDPGEMFHASSEADLLAELCRLRVESETSPADEARMRKALPLIRADFATCETYSWRPDAPLECPIAACGGTLDPDWPVEHLRAWQGHTGGPFSLTMFAGDHFFIHSCQAELVRSIAGELASIVEEV